VQKWSLAIELTGHKLDTFGEMEIRGRSNVSVKLSVRIYIAIGDGKNMQRQPVSDTVSL